MSSDKKKKNVEKTSNHPFRFT